MALPRLLRLAAFWMVSQIPSKKLPTVSHTDLIASHAPVNMPVMVSHMPDRNSLAPPNTDSKSVPNQPRKTSMIPFMVSIAAENIPSMPPHTPPMIEEIPSQNPSQSPENSEANVWKMPTITSRTEPTTAETALKAPSNTGASRLQKPSQTFFTTSTAAFTTSPNPPNLKPSLFRVSVIFCPNSSNFFLTPSQMEVILFRKSSLFFQRWTKAAIRTAMAATTAAIGPTPIAAIFFASFPRRPLPLLISLNSPPSFLLSLPPTNSTGPMAATIMPMVTTSFFVLSSRELSQSTNFWTFSTTFRMAGMIVSIMAMESSWRDDSRILSCPFRLSWVTFAMFSALPQVSSMTSCRSPREMPRLLTTSSYLVPSSATRSSAVAKSSALPLESWRARSNSSLVTPMASIRVFMLSTLCPEESIFFVKSSTEKPAVLMDSMIFWKSSSEALRIESRPAIPALPPMAEPNAAFWMLSAPWAAASSWAFSEAFNCLSSAACAVFMADSLSSWDSFSFLSWACCEDLSASS